MEYPPAVFDALTVMQARALFQMPSINILVSFGKVKKIGILLNLICYIMSKICSIILPFSKM